MSGSSFKIADVIAPEKLAGLQPVTTVGIDIGHIHAMPKVSDAPGEDWPDAKMINELAKRMGFREHFFEDWEESLDLMLSDSGMNYKEFCVKRSLHPNVERLAPHAYMPMLLTAEHVARKYRIAREAQDAYALSSQQRTAAAQAAGRFDQEIVPLAAAMAVTSKETGEISFREVTLDRDEGGRADTTAEGLAGFKPVVEGGTIIGGNASQLSDGTSACVVMERRCAERRGVTPLGIYRGIAVAGNAPEEVC